RLSLRAGRRAAGRWVNGIDTRLDRSGREGRASDTVGDPGGGGENDDGGVLQTAQDASGQRSRVCAPTGATGRIEEQRMGEDAGGVGRVLCSGTGMMQMFMSLLRPHAMSGQPAVDSRSEERRVGKEGRCGG